MKIFLLLYNYLNKLFKLSSTNKDIESNFQNDIQIYNIEQNKIAIIVSIIFHILYIGVAYLKTPEDFITTVIAILCVPISLSLIFLYKIQRNTLQKNAQFQLFLYGIGIGFSPALLLNVTDLYYEVYILNTMLPIIAIYVMYGVPFTTATLINTLILSSVIASITLIDINIEDQVYYIFLLIVTFTLSALSGYLVEKNQRRLFLSKYQEQELHKKMLKTSKLLQEQSRLAQMGEMISMIAHQWRQPLGAINSAIIGVDIKLKSGKMDFDKKEDREKFLKHLNKKHENVHGYVKVLSSTIDDFRNFFKPGKDKEDVSLVLPIKRALEIVQSSMESKNITIISDFKIDNTVSIYHNEMMQVILNILKNSEDNFLEKNTENPTIKITTTQDENYYVIFIQDNGGGIPTDIIDNIFDPYFSTKDEKNGSGLGLYMSKTIVEEHNNGRLRVTNIQGEYDVCFEISLKIPNSKYTSLEGRF